MNSKERNEQIRKLYEIDGWTQETIASKFGISVRQIRRILKVDVQVDALVKKLEKKIETINYTNDEIFKYALFNGKDMINTSNDLKDFESNMGVQLSPGRLNWINQRLEESDSAIMNGFEIKLSKSVKDEKESLTLESLQKRVNKLESIFREIMETTHDYDVINIIKKNL